MLAPAKNLESGCLAINYGADAVYIGADRFGARAAASNSVADIEKLVQYAHKYRAKTFVTLNTILFDDELEDAERLIHQLYNAGVDALIIQDMGILKMNIPPIPLHASTQTNNFDLERIQFLDQLGLERIVLARELSFKEIRNISQHIKTDLEYFVHGALCVSLSGQCYFSQTITGRSANRGACAQMCRHPYHLLDARGNRIVTDGHLLSLKDLNLGDHLKTLLDAGVMSLKIEGRLKDANYVKNVVSYYRQKLDQVLVANTKYIKASSGHTSISFDPDPERSFNRGSTTYFLMDRTKGMVNSHSPKSMGKHIGFVTSVGQGILKAKLNEKLNNGDGLCFIYDNKLHGIRAEKVEDGQIRVSDSSMLKKGLALYRNYDHEFTKRLEADKSLRKIKAKINVSQKDDKLLFTIKDEDNLSSAYSVLKPDERATNAALALNNFKKQLSKSGESMFQITSVDIASMDSYFFRMGKLNEIRRSLFEQHEAYRITTYKRKTIIRKTDPVPFPAEKLDFSENIANKKAEQFYKDHGVKKQEKALEISNAQEDQLLMTTRYCIKYEMGYCQRFQDARETPPEPLYLQDENRKYKLGFDCRNCMMTIRLA